MWEKRIRKTISHNKNLVGKYSKPKRLAKDTEGKPITYLLRTENRWVKLIENLLNRSTPLNTPDIEVTHTDLPINVVSQTIGDIGMVIRQIKSEKAAVPDNIPVLALWSDTKVNANMLHVLFGKIWEEEQVSTDWERLYIIGIPSKRESSECKNYRSTTPLSVSGDVFNRVLLNRMGNSVDTQLCDQQTGFLEDRSCTDQIVTLWIIVEQSIERNTSLCLNSFNYEKVFENATSAIQSCFPLQVSFMCLLTSLSRLARLRENMVYSGQLGYI